MGMRAAFAAIVVGMLLAGAAVAQPPLAKAPRVQGQAAPQDFRLNATLSGSALSTATGEGFSVIINLTGLVARSVPPGEGNGEQERGDVDAHVRIVDPESNATVAEFDTTAAYHAERASYIAQGLDGWRFNLETHGREGDLLHFGLHGNVTGTSTDDGRTSYLLQADGPVNVKEQGAHRATHFSLAATGSATEDAA
jgi:hypothetical protein